MGLLDSFERGLERAVNGAFAKTFRSGVQPVEIASALRSELDANAAVVSRDRILVPNLLTVSLSRSDLERMQRLGPALLDELHGIITRHARSQGYSFPGPVRIDLALGDRLTTGQVRTHSRTSAAEVSWRGVLEIAGARHPLVASRTVIGRGTDAGVTIADTGASRRHAEILWDGQHAMVRDLGSTNGTLLDGRAVRESALAPDSTIRIGRTDIVFRVVAEAAAAPDATQAFSLRDAERFGDPSW